MRTGVWMNTEGFNGIAPKEWKKPVPKKQQSFHVRVAQPRPVPILHFYEQRVKELEERAATERENKRIMEEAQEAHRIELARQEEERKQEHEEYLRRRRNLRSCMKENYPIMPRDGPFLYYMEDGLCKMVYPEQASNGTENKNTDTKPTSASSSTPNLPIADAFVPIRIELDKCTLRMKKIDCRIIGVHKKAHHAGRLLKQRIPTILAKLEEEKEQVYADIKIWGAKQEEYLKKQWQTDPQKCN